MSDEKVMTREEVHGLLTRLFDAFTDLTTTRDCFDAIMTPGYRQRVDGKELDYLGFLEHHAALHSAISSASVHIEHMVTDGRSAATVHIAEAIKTTGERIRLKVVAYYQFRNGRVSFVDELTHLLVGSDNDRDLGSRL